VVCIKINNVISPSKQTKDTNPFYDRDSTLESTRCIQSCFKSELISENLLLIVNCKTEIVETYLSIHSIFIISQYVLRFDMNELFLIEYIKKMIY
jgi:hypothetical protein